ncbi:Piso0_000648 [Millerozyma farinosa CBS 7064]|uniref:Piso0_000648 protein n=1 Tax=Pichia sorbitophila (strain ATCC MYA-4447 / BCRC 22081 / CBS 7064 / NBRC 10061 / NRRL Y-12695) TaxID=559304 RepID=G8YR48_PICSO|nr:Piso0_000648 [Millerozyma farinosa CBS 7064]
MISYCVYHAVRQIFAVCPVRQKIKTNSPYPSLPIQRNSSTSKLRFAGSSALYPSTKRSVVLGMRKTDSNTKLSVFVFVSRGIGSAVKDNEVSPADKTLLYLESSTFTIPSRW